MLQEDTTQSKHSYIVMELAPYGDFKNLLQTKKFFIEEKLIRTYFHQLIQGIAYLHSQGIAHLDLKPENLLLGEDYQLKIYGFEHAWMIGDKEISWVGTKYFRAPELHTEECDDPMAADIYTAGILLFNLKCNGNFPHLENMLCYGINFYELMQCQNQCFWEKHAEIQKKPDNFFTEEFRELFNSMTQAKPNKRANLDEIKNSNWYKGPVYEKEELKEYIKFLFSNNN